MEKNKQEEKINSILSDFKKQTILVIGDVMLDKYISGDVNRISPEAPIQVVNVQKERFVPGGASNVCNNLASLGAKTFIAGVTGLDINSKILFTCLDKKNINHSLIIKNKKRITTLKTRITGKNQQLLRIDYENTNKIDDKTEKELIKKIETNIKKYGCSFFCLYYPFDWAFSIFATPLVFIQIKHNLLCKYAGKFYRHCIPHHFISVAKVIIFEDKIVWERLNTCTFS